MDNNSTLYGHRDHQNTSTNDDQEQNITFTQTTSKLPTSEEKTVSNNSLRTENNSEKVLHSQYSESYQNCDAITQLLNQNLMTTNQTNNVQLNRPIHAGTVEKQLVVNPRNCQYTNMQNQNKTFNSVNQQHNNFLKQNIPHENQGRVTQGLNSHQYIRPNDQQFVNTQGVPAKKQKLSQYDDSAYKTYTSRNTQPFLHQQASQPASQAFNNSQLSITHPYCYEKPSLISLQQVRLATTKMLEFEKALFTTLRDDFKENYELSRKFYDDDINKFYSGTLHINLCLLY